MKFNLNMLFKFSYVKRVRQILLLVGMSLINTTFFCQDYERIDATIMLYPEQPESAEQLSKFITRDFFTEEDKVRAIYSWIILNIAYDPEEYKQFNFTFKNYRERNEKEEILREKIIKRTLQKGVAVCEGYAMLFEKLCELQGITNYLVRGDIKTNFNDIGRPFKNSHMWNVAIIDGTHYLFDPTWGAGRYNEKFIKEPSYFYYKTQPELLFKTHYPGMYEDAFIDGIISKEVFADMPLIILDSLKIEDVESPLNGIIMSDMYFDTIDFAINNCNPTEITYSYGKKKVPVKNMSIDDGKLHFSVPLELGVTTLLIYFDNLPALGYVIK